MRGSQTCGFCIAASSILLGMETGFGESTLKSTAGLQGLAFRF